MVLDLLVEHHCIERFAGHRTTKFTRCAPCGAVAPRVLGSARPRSRTAHKRDACSVRRRESLRPQNGLRRRRLQPFRRVNSALGETAPYTIFLLYAPSVARRGTESMKREHRSKPIYNQIAILTFLSILAGTLVNCSAGRRPEAMVKTVVQKYKSGRENHG